MFPWEPEGYEGRIKVLDSGLNVRVTIVSKTSNWKVLIHQRHRRPDGLTVTDRRTERRHAIAIPRFALGLCIAR